MGSHHAAANHSAPSTGHHGPRPPLIFISAAEPSADQHAASLIRAALAMDPEIRFVGVAGPKMRDAGCRGIFDMTRHAAMLLGALGAVGKGVRVLNTADAYLRRFPFDAAVVIDSPTLHLPLARKAQAAGVPVLYYITPQMWAWGGWRIHKLRGVVEKAAVILPFEEAFFRNQGVDAHYVGHPLIEQLARRPINPARVAELRRGGPLVALLPGSRKHVVSEVLGGQLDVARQIARAVPGVRFGVSVASDGVAPIIEAAVAASGLDAATFPGGHDDLVEAAELVLVASGTTTLELACRRRPMIAMYNASRVFYHLVARWLLKTPYYALPNILAGREIVPEFMPYYTSTVPIAEKAIALLLDPALRAEMSAALGEVVATLGTKSASQETARMLLQIVAARRGH